MFDVPSILSSEKANFVPHLVCRESQAASGAAPHDAAMGDPVDCIPDALSPLSIPLQFGRHDEIIAQDDDAEYCFMVISGCVRTVRLLEDGRRMVGAFLLPGDFFGLEASGVSSFSAEAVTSVTLRRFRLSAVEELAAREPALALRLRRIAWNQVRLMQDHLLLLGRLRAAERIATFLLEMADRLQAGGENIIHLPMCRTDIADYLCLTTETVSRGLTELRQHRAIEVDRANIAVSNRTVLQQFAGGPLPT